MGHYATIRTGDAGAAAAGHEGLGHAVVALAGAAALAVRTSIENEEKEVHRTALGFRKDDGTKSRSFWFRKEVPAGSKRGQGAGWIQHAHILHLT